MRATRPPSAGASGGAGRWRSAAAGIVVRAAALAAVGLAPVGCGGGERAEETPPDAGAEGPGAADTAREAGAVGSDSVRVSLYLVALEAGGERGMEIGCGDALVAVERAVSVSDTTAAARLRAALAALLRTEGAEPGSVGEADDSLYNALRRSDLRLDALIFAGDRVEARLTGGLRMGGACDAPRVEAQLRETVRTITGAEQITILLDGEPLERLLSGRGP